MKKSTTPKLSRTHFSILGIVAVAAIVGGIFYFYKKAEPKIEADEIKEVIKLAKESKKSQMADMAKMPPSMAKMPPSMAKMPPSMAKMPPSMAKMADMSEMADIKKAEAVVAALEMGNVEKAKELGMKEGFRGHHHRRHHRRHYGHAPWNSRWNRVYDGPIYPVDPVVEIEPVITQPVMTQPVPQPAPSPHSDELNTLAIYAIPTVAIVAIIFMMGSMSNRK